VRKRVEEICGGGVSRWPRVSFLTSTVGSEGCPSTKFVKFWDGTFDVFGIVFWRAFCAMTAPLARGNSMTLMGLRDTMNHGCFGGFTARAFEASATVDVTEFVGQLRAREVDFQGDDSERH
jgi:hypothetical protein